jgi:hypothetical protein
LGKYCLSKPLVFSLEPRISRLLYGLSFNPCQPRKTNETPQPHDDKITIEFTPHELHLANALIQEGQCDSPEGQALADGIRSIVIRLEEAAKSDFESGGTH